MSLTVKYVYVCIIINTCGYVCIYIYMYTLLFLSFFLGFVMSLRTKYVDVYIRICACGCVCIYIHTYILCPFGPFLGVFEVVDCQVCMCLFRHKYMWISFVIFWHVYFALFALFLGGFDVVDCQVYICVYEHKYMQIDIYIYDRFHWTRYNPENHQIQKLKFVGTNSNETKISIWICTTRYRGIWVSRFGGFWGYSFYSGNCHIYMYTLPFWLSFRKFRCRWLPSMYMCLLAWIHVDMYV